MNKFILLFFFALNISLLVFAQNMSQVNTPQVSDPPPGNITLIGDYIHSSKRGIDTRIGVINKPNGMTIYYDIGRFAGKVAAKCRVKNACLWYKEQQINGQEVWIGLGKEGSIYATFPKNNANFYAETKSAEDIADFLIMILTY